DILAMIAPVRQERLANPQDHILLLLLQRNAGPDASVNVEAHTVTERERKVLEPAEVLLRNGICMVDPIAVEGFLTSVPQPRQFVLMLRSVDQHVLVIAAQADDPVGCTELRFDQKARNVAASPAPVNVVANEHKARQVCAAMCRAMFEQVHKFRVAA